MKIKKEMKKILDTFSLEDVEKYSSSIFETCVIYLNSNLKDINKEDLNIRYQVSIEGDNRIAASANKTDGKYIVKVSMPTWFIIYSYCHCMVEQPDIYRVLALGEKETLEGKLKYAGILTQMMLKILFFHELGHIYNGHIDYIKDKEKTYMELNSEWKPGYADAFSYEGRKARPFIAPEMWQALEWNADDFSATRMVAQYTYDENVGNLGLRDKGQSLFFLIISFVSLYSLMDMGKMYSNDKKYKEEEHLPKRIRLNKCIETMFTAYRYFYNEEPPFKIKEVKKTFIKCFENWTEAFMRTYFEDYNMSNLSSENNINELDEEHMNYYNKVDNFYARNLSKELEKYSYFTVMDERTEIRGEVLNLFAKEFSVNVDEFEIEGIIDGKIFKL